LIPNDITLVWSTKLHLFLYRYILSLKLNDQKKQIISNESDNTHTGVNNIEFEIETCAHVHIQLSNDYRYIEITIFYVITFTLYV
jgi:hypothetical protein